MISRSNIRIIWIVLRLIAIITLVAVVIWERHSGTSDVIDRIDRASAPEFHATILMVILAITSAVLIDRFALRLILMLVGDFTTATSPDTKHPSYAPVRTSFGPRRSN